MWMKRRKDLKKPVTLKCYLQFNIFKYKMLPKQGLTLPVCCLKRRAFSRLLDSNIVEFELQNKINLAKHIHLNSHNILDFP